MNTVNDENWRYVFQLIKNHADKQDVMIQSVQNALTALQTENESLKRQVQDLSEHAIIDSLEKGGT